MKKILYISFLFFLATGCNSQTIEEELLIKSLENTSAQRFDTTAILFQNRINPPIGFTRVPLDSNSFGHYLRNLPLKPHGSSVYLFDGRLKANQEVHCAIIDQDLDPVDLQQCADAVMRLRAEYLFKQKRFKDIHFNFVSDSKPRYFLEYAKGDLSYKKFRSYLKHIFSYANTGSLKKELIPVANMKDLQIGDILIQSGNPYGHAVTIMDVAQNAEGEKIFLLAQSYMPAQETHVLINPNNSDLSPWYSFKIDPIETPEWTFYAIDLRRFSE